MTLTITEVFFKRNVIGIIGETKKGLNDSMIVLQRVYGSIRSVTLRTPAEALAYRKTPSCVCFM